MGLFSEAPLGLPHMDTVVSCKGHLPGKALWWAGEEESYQVGYLVTEETATSGCVFSPFSFWVVFKVISIFYIMFMF